MFRVARLVGITALLAGCAENRLSAGSERFGRDISELPIREVMANLSDTVRDPHQIPSRTTFGEGKLSVTDTVGISAGVPFNNYARSGGILSVKAGDYIDQYSIGLKPETDSGNLRGLRDLYRHAAYPDFSASDPFSARHPTRWLFWTDRSGVPVPDAVSAASKPDLVYVGSSSTHDFYARDGSIFSDFVLATFGASAAKPDAVKLTRSSGRMPADSAARRSDARGPRFVPGGTVIGPRKEPTPLFVAPPAQVIQ